MSGRNRDHRAETSKAVIRWPLRLPGGERTEDIRRAIRSSRKGEAGGQKGPICGAAPARRQWHARCSTSIDTRSGKLKNMATFVQALNNRHSDQRPALDPDDEFIRCFG